MDGDRADDARFGQVMIESPGFIVRTELATPDALPLSQLEVRSGRIEVQLNSKTLMAIDSAGSSFYTMRHDKSGAGTTFKIGHRRLISKNDINAVKKAVSMQRHSDLRHVSPATTETKPTLRDSIDGLRSPHLDGYQAIEQAIAHNERIFLDRRLCVTVPEAIANYGTAGLVMGQSPNELLRNWTCN